MVKAELIGDGPLAVIERIKFITPLKVEEVGVWVPSLILDPIGLCVPWHGRVITACTPILGVSVRARRPHVEHDVLVLVLIVDTGVTSKILLHDLVIYNKCHLIGSPDELVDFCSSSRVKASIISLVLDSVMTIAVAQVQAEGCRIKRRHNFYLDAVPAEVVIVGPGPLCEETEAGALGSRASHARDKFAVKELLSRGDLTTDIRRGGCVNCGEDATCQESRLLH